MYFGDNGVARIRGRSLAYYSSCLPSAIKHGLQVVDRPKSRFLAHHPALEFGSPLNQPDCCAAITVLLEHGCRMSNRM